MNPCSGDHKSTVEAKNRLLMPEEKRIFSSLLGFRETEKGLEAGSARGRGPHFRCFHFETEIGQVGLP
jgi:hypothetical protein